MRLETFLLSDSEPYSNNSQINKQMKAKLPAASELHSNLSKLHILAIKAKSNFWVQSTDPEHLQNVVNKQSLLFQVFNLSLEKSQLLYLNRPANTEKWKALLTTEELLFIFCLMAITRNMKNKNDSTKIKHLYKLGCYSPSKSRWALHEIPNIPILNWSRITEYFMLKRAIWGDLVWSPFPKWGHSELYKRNPNTNSACR